MRDQLDSLYHGQRGIAAILLLFAMSAFSVLSVAMLTTGIGSAAAGQTFSIFSSVPQDALTKFVAPIVVPNDWRTQGGGGSFQFQLPVLVPETGSDESGSTSAWHAMNEVPGVAVCCESRAGICAQRLVATGGAPIEDWNPGPDDALRLSLDLASRPEPAASDASGGDAVTATLTAAGVMPEGTPVSCQLEFDGAVIAKGIAVLTQTTRPEGSVLATPLVAGRMTLAVKTR